MVQRKVQEGQDQNRDNITGTGTDFADYSNLRGKSEGIYQQARRRSHLALDLGMSTDFDLGVA
jgi:hypothetical protein